MDRRPEKTGRPGVTAADYLPETRTLAGLKKAALACEGCELHRHAHQTVFGDGPGGARVVLVGEQPGDREDRTGKPFVGPAGRLLDQALAEAGIPRETVYLTNAVKHFKWKPVGKRRIHQPPRSREVNACRPWLIAELETVQPDGIVCLGATAAQALIGPDFRVTRDRGRMLGCKWAQWIMATVHPSSLLRSVDREQEYHRFVADLTEAVHALERGGDHAIRHP